MGTESDFAGPAFIDVSIPARDEEERIGTSLGAFCRQVDAGGSLIGRERFRVTLLANGCSDRTAERARALAEKFPHVDLRVVEAGAREIPNVGAARKFLMDRAAVTFLANDRPEGIVATTDADTIVATDWIERTALEMNGVDAVGGVLTLDATEARQLPPEFQTYYEHELAYREEFTHLESVTDPVRHDPWPRHGSFAGASLAVTARAYVACGGVRAVPTLEDRDLSESLTKIGARIRHSLAVRAITSPRCFSRVEGGFATFLESLQRRGLSRTPHLVEHPLVSLSRMRERADARQRGASPIAMRFGESDPTLLPDIAIEEAVSMLRSLRMSVAS